VDELKARTWTVEKAKALKKAAALKTKMLKEAPEAGKKAAAPYIDAMGRAAAVANEYTKRGDGLIGQSVVLQGEAGLKMGEANSYSNLGDMVKSQATLQMAHQTMDLAKSLAGAADGNYGKAKSIMSTLGGYASEAAAAQYHAEYMLNPDLPPPPAPLV